MADLADRRKAALDELTREGIRAAAMKVIGAHGINGMTMAEVADAAGVAKGTLYNYFEDKDALIIHVVMKGFEPLADQLEAIADTDVSPVEQLTRTTRVMFDLVAQHRALISLVAQAREPVNPKSAMPDMMRLTVRIEKAVTRIVARGVDQKVFRARDPVTIARLFIGTLHGLVAPRMFEGGASSVDDDVRDVIDLFLHGISVTTRSASR